HAIPKLDGLDDADLVAQLESPNGTVRDLVHQMLLWRRAAGVPALLKEMARYGRRPTARMQALCILDGLGSYDWSLLNEALADPHPGVVRHALRISAGRFSTPELAARFGDAPEDAFVAKELAALLNQGHEDAPFLLE